MKNDRGGRWAWRKSFWGLVLLGGLFLWPTATTRAAPADPDDASDVLLETNDLFKPWTKFAADDPPCVCMVVTQAIDELRAQAAQQDGLKKILQLRDRVEELSGLPCTLVHYTQIKRDGLEQPNIRAIVFTAWKIMKNKRQAEEMAALLRETKRPLIGFCGGFHQIYYAYGGRGEAMRKLRPGEADLNPKYMPGQYKEWGPTAVRIVRRDPLFAGLPDEMVMPERHYAQCVVLPEVFEVLASSDECRVQVIKHKTRLVYGTQFHPEAYDYEYRHGRTLLANFFRLAGIDTAKTVPAYVAALRAKAAAGLADAYASAVKVRTAKEPLVVYVDIEHPDRVRSRLEALAGKKQGNVMEENRARLAALSGLPTLMVHYTQVTRKDLENPPIRAIVLSGRAGPAVEALQWDLVDLIRTTDKPLLGLCGGHQLIGEAFGATVDRMRRLKPGEEDPYPRHWPGFYKEWAFLPIRIVQADPLFQGFTGQIVAREYHAAEIKQLPAGFTLLASTDECRIQAIKHRTRLLYGTQFHPERYDDEHRDGQKVLANFFHMAGLGAK